jgi:heme/copper-type cytochrome/quinol oxidase subunit 3
VSALPWSYDQRPDTRTSTVRLGIWLFLASETMLFGSLFSGYVLLRSGSAVWPDSAVLNARHALVMTPVLVAATMVFGRGRAPNQQARLIGSSVLFALFAGMKLLDYQEKVAADLLPSTNLLLACWFTITAMHALHVAGGVGANLWLALGLGRDSARDRERLYALRLYWYFVDSVWFVILVSFYLV